MGQAEARPVVTFRYSGRFAHFLRAEASASALSYPVPPRTALLGLIGAVLGFAKDTPQTVLDEALIALSGPLPKTHWHRAKLRKDPPALLPLSVKAGAKGSSSPEKATLIKQEWLLDPDYLVTAGLPAPHHDELVRRLKERAWYYTPCLGLSEMLADLTFVAESVAEPLTSDTTLHCAGVIPQASVRIDGDAALDASLALQVIRMPRDVTAERVFHHANYLVERDGRAIPVSTTHAWRLSGDGDSSARAAPLVFL